jgi:transglutaminase-like putative cysteine protease
VLSSVAMGLALALAVPVTLTDRADPRRDERPQETRALVDPIESVIALRAIDPPIELHRVQVGDDTVPTHWRTAALEAYDGTRWTPELTLRPIGRRLGPDSTEAVEARVEFVTDDLDLVPVPGRPITVDADVLTDAGRTVVRLVDRPDAGDAIDLVAEPGARTSAAADAAIATRQVDEIAAGFTSTAEAIGGAGTLRERLGAIERTMRDEFTLDSDAPGAGLQRTLIERFLTDTRRGSAEQFVTAFVLLARSLGVDSRVATGFVMPGEVVAGEDGTAIGSDLAAAWPEVRFEGIGWVPFDPVPEEEAGGDVEAPQTQLAQSPPAVQPPAPPQEERPDQPEEEQPVVEPVDDQGWSEVVEWTVRSVTITAIVLSPLLVAIVAILWAKRRRRRRRLAASWPVDRIRGAWAVATDALVDAGLTIRAAWTDDQIASAGSSLAPAARYEIRRLGRLSSSATFGGLVRDDGLVAEAPLLADDAVASVRRIEDVLAANRTRSGRWRWRLSLRSLRAATRSPVLGDVVRAR